MIRTHNWKQGKSGVKQQVMQWMHTTIVKIMEGKDSNVLFLFYCMIDTHKPHIKIEEQDFYTTLLNITTSRAKKVEMFVSTMGFERWVQGEHIQKCLPELSPEERELLISGLDYEDQKLIFAEPED